MATYNMEGTVKLIEDLKTFPSGFSKRAFVLTSDGDRYPQDVLFECVKDKASLLDPVREGQKVNVSFDIQGREYNGRYFVNLSAWKITAADGAGASAPGEGEPPLDETDALGDDPDDIF